MKPPRYAEATLRALLADNADLREAILGDVTEGWAMQAGRFGPHVANRWYWAQTLRSLPSIVALWGQTAGPRRVVAVAAIAVLARSLMLILQYAAIAACAAMTSGHPSLVISLVVGAGCVGAAAVTGHVVRRIHAQDLAARVGALCIATLCCHVVSPHLIHAALPAWGFWVTTSPLSAVAVVFGATHGRHRSIGAFV